MSQQKIPLQILCTSQEKIALLSEYFDCSETVLKRSTEKMIGAAKEKVEVKGYKLGAFDKQGHLIIITRNSDGLTLGYGIVSEPVSNDWCTQHSNPVISLAITQRNETQGRNSYKKKDKKNKQLQAIT